MDYEKKYEDLLHKAKKLHDENCDGCKVCLESLFSELAESEDEKIRKELEETIGMAAINYCGGSRGSDEMVRAAYYDGARIWYEEAINKAYEWLIDRYENQGAVLLEDINEFKSAMEEQ